MSRLRHPDDLPPEFFAEEAPARRRPPKVPPPPPEARCKRDARAQVVNRGPGWIGKTADIIQTHNKNIEQDRRCARCNSDAPIIWGKGFED